MAIKFFDEEEIRKAVSIIKPCNELFEVRIIGAGRTLSGYFCSADKLIEQLNKQNLSGANVYWSLQRLHTGCAARMQYGIFLEIGKARLPGTSDNDILSYSWIPIDVDPCRPSGISATDEEVQEAVAVADNVHAYMTEQGFIDYVRVFSGNGIHLLYRINWKNNDETKASVKNILYRADELFSTAGAHIDIGNHNPSRILKLPGTLAQKGRNTSTRPHRISKILEVNLS